MRLLLKIIVICVFAFNVSGQNEQAFIIYNSKGKKVSYKKMLKSAVKQEYIFFGEHHDNPISHWLELELLKDLFKNMLLNYKLVLKCLNKISKYC